MQSNEQQGGNMNAPGNALISVYNKQGVEAFAKGLHDLGWQIYASGGTAKAIEAAGVPVIDVADLAGGEAILGHRVVTLSREVHAGILADKTPEHTAELERLKIPRIDLVCVDMYPLKEAIVKPDSTETSIIELTDIGGPTMLRGAAKGRRIVLSRADQREPGLKWLGAGRPAEEVFLHELATTAEYEVARYVFDSAEYLASGEVAGFMGRRAAVPKYGENPWQGDAGLFVDRDTNDPLAISRFTLKEGSDLSFNNYADVDRLLQTMTHIAAGFERNYGNVPAIALGAKHGNVCGAAVAGTPAEAIKNMLAGDPRAIFGGSVMLNFAVTAEVADLLMTHGMVKGKRLLDVVAAAGVDASVLTTLKRKGGKLRVFVNPALAKVGEQSLDRAKRFRYVRGGMLAQDNYTFVLDRTSPELERQGELEEQHERGLVLAWAIGSTSNSNTITLVKNAMLIGNGVGQQDRVSAAELATKRATDVGHDVKGAVAYSDSFFPFPDGPEALAKAGVVAIFASRGSVQDAAVLAAMQKAKVAFWTMPDALARGFYAH
jgi:phosphoribosylaminoimidazolecarboxamide formyltransferase/IMP cyclohydrolase